MGKKKKNRKTQRSGRLLHQARKGLPILAADDDPVCLFANGSLCPPAEDFATLLEQHPGDMAQENQAQDAASSPPENSTPQSVISPLEIQSQLDLHGLKAAAARHRVNAYLLTQRQAGRIMVRIITGRGKHSQGPAILPGLVEEILAAACRRGIIQEYHWENQTRDASGAVLVRLR